MSPASRLILAVLLATTCGCTGVGFTLAAEGDLEGPISLTTTVLAPDGSKLRIGEGLDFVEEFEERKRFWGVFTIPLGRSRWDITELANEALQASGGEGIVGLTVESEACGYLPFAALAPIIPSYMDVTLRGQIVRRADE